MRPRDVTYIHVHVLMLSVKKADDGQRREGSTATLVGPTVSLHCRRTRTACLVGHLQSKISFTRRQRDEGGAKKVQTCADGCGQKADIAAKRDTMTGSQSAFQVCRGWSNSESDWTSGSTFESGPNVHRRTRTRATSGDLAAS